MRCRARGVARLRPRQKERAGGVPIRPCGKFSYSKQAARVPAIRSRPRASDFIGSPLDMLEIPSGEPPMILPWHRAKSRHEGTMIERDHCANGLVETAVAPATGAWSNTILRRLIPLELPFRDQTSIIFSRATRCSCRRRRRRHRPPLCLPAKASAVLTGSGGGEGIFGRRRIKSLVLSLLTGHLHPSSL